MENSNITKVKDLDYLRTAPNLNKIQAKRLFKEVESILYEADWITIGVIAPSKKDGIDTIREIRTLVNKSLEECRINQKLGSSLEAAVKISPKNNYLDDALRFLHDKGDKSVDRLFDWLIVSSVQIGGEPWAEVLLEKDDQIANIEIAKARGIKCERCWHYELDVGKDPIYKGLCV